MSTLYLRVARMWSSPVGRRPPQGFLRSFSSSPHVGQGRRKRASRNTSDVGTLSPVKENRDLSAHGAEFQIAESSEPAFHVDFYPCDRQASAELECLPLLP